MYCDFQIEWDSKAVTTVIDIVKRPQSKRTCIVHVQVHCTSRALSFYVANPWHV